jgi:hypothetical protein
MAGVQRLRVRAGGAGDAPAAPGRLPAGAVCGGQHGRRSARIGAARREQRPTLRTLPEPV